MLKGGKKAKKKKAFYTVVSLGFQLSLEIDFQLGAGGSQSCDP